MDRFRRYAVYYVPRDGDFAQAAAAWLGWDLARGRAVAQPDLPGLAALTAAPRAYGFHGTLKPPFRLAPGTDAGALDAALAGLAGRLPVAGADRLRLALLEGFLALVPVGDAAIAPLAAEVVAALDPFRAPLTEAEIARRRPDRLTPRQRALLDRYGYPHVMEEFRFHLTLSGRVEAADAARLTAAARAQFAGRLPAPFRIEDLCLCGEDAAGRFNLLRRHPLGG